MGGDRLFRRACTAALLVLSTAGAAAPPAEIVGRWELLQQEYDLVIEFRENGTYIAHTAVGAMTGRWEMVDAAHLVTWSSEQRPRRVNVFRLEGDSLIIIDASGEELIHRRLEAPAAE